MYSEGVSARRLSAWTFAAVVPAAIQLTARASWLSVLVAALFSLLCIMLVWRWGITPASKGYQIVMWILVVLLLSKLSGETIRCWPEGGHKAVAVILLGLALWSAWKGPGAASRAGCVIFWLMLLVYPVLFGAGIKAVEVKWLSPGRADISALGCILLLTPAAAAVLLDHREKTVKPKLILTGVFCVLAACITAGVLSPGVASDKENAFYEMTRSLSLFGKARRFEAVLSAAATTGWFLLMSLYLTLCGKMAHGIHSGWERKTMLIAAGIAAISVAFDIAIPEVILLLLALILWVAVPIYAKGVSLIKKS